MRIEPYARETMPGLQALVNRHLEAVVPGWSLSAGALSRHLARDETEVVTDRWVVGRETWSAVEGDRLLGVAHLLRYGDGPEVGGQFRDLGEIGWALASPGDSPALDALLGAARERFAAWGVRQESGWGAGLPAGPFGGVPESWPHVAAALAGAGYRPAAEGREPLYGGTLAGIAPPGPPPVEGVALRRTVGAWGTRFAAVHDGREIGHAEGLGDLSYGGALPAPVGWAELQELWVEEAWRDRGVGGWLVRHLVAWLRLGGAERIVLAVAAGDEAAGAGRFYRRFGWESLARSARDWRLGE